MTRGVLALLGCLVALVSLAGCGTKEKTGYKISGDTLTIYSSVPLHGASSVSGFAVVSGAQLALAQIHSRIGKYRVVLKSLDDSTVQGTGWDPGVTTINARLAVKDKTTIGYIGDLNSGASAISIPVLNRVEIPQISPAGSAVGLTSAAPGAEPGEPAKYYPTGIRTYARVVPSDAIEAAVQVQLQKSVGCTKTYVLDDGEVDGEDTASSFDVAAQASKLSVVATTAFVPSATSYSSLAASVAHSGANCVLVSALTEHHAVLVTKQIAAAAPDDRIFVPSELAESTFTNPANGGIPIALDPRVLVTIAPLDDGASVPAGRAALAEYARDFGPPEPDAILGYEAMSLMLSAISRATDHGRDVAERSKVVRAIFDTRDRHSVLGVYSITPTGDTTLTRYGVYRIVDGQLQYWQAMTG